MDVRVLQRPAGGGRAKASIPTTSTPGASGGPHRAGADHEQGVEPQVLHRDAHRPGEARLFGVLELVAHPPPFVEEEEIELGPSLRAPEEGLVRARLPEHLLEGEALPGTAHLGVRVELGGRAQAEEVMEEAGVSQRDLR